MKTNHARYFLRLSLVACGLSAALMGTALADPVPVKAEDGSKHWAAVSKHLELGGLFFGYIDIDGDVAGLAKIGDQFIDFARKDKSNGIPARLSAAAIAEAAGLNCVKAIGMSSRKLGNDLYHNHSLLYMPGGPAGLLKVFGGKAAPLQIASLAPKGTDLAVQMELKLSTLLETAENVLKGVGDDNIMQQFKTGLGFPLPGNMTVGGLISNLDLRIMVIGKVEEGKTVAIPGAPFEVPAFQLMVAIEGVDFLMEPLLNFAGEADQVTVEKGDGFTMLRPAMSLPGALDKQFRPALYHDHKSKRVFLTSHVDYVKEVLSGASKLADGDEYKTATAGLPVEANGISYATSRLMKTVLAFYKQAMEAAAASGPPEMKGMMGALMDIMTGLGLMPEKAMASVFANVPEGMLIVSNLSENHKHTLVAATVVPFAIIASAASVGYAQARTKAAESTRARAAAEAEEEQEAQEPPSKSIKNNLQQIAFSAQTYFIDNPSAKEVSYEKLVQSELIFELDAVSGESYKGLKLKRTGGSLAVKTKAGDSITVKYPAVTD